MKTILVPTDFSDAARNASEYAVNLAKEINAKVMLYHVYHFPIPVNEVPVMIFSVDELQKENEAFLKKEAEGLMLNTGVLVSYKADIGLASDSILMEAPNVDLIIMGMQGAHKRREPLLGSVTTSVLRKSSVPVLVIPFEAKYKTPKKIVFAADYNASADLDSIDIIKEFVEIFHSKLLILNVKRKMEDVVMEEARASIHLENKLSEVEHAYFFSERENIVEGINDFIKKYNVDMVAVIPHHYNMLERLFHSSISKKMAFHTYVPMLSLPDKQ